MKTESKFQTRATAETPITASNVSNGWKMGDGTEVGSYADRILFKFHGVYYAVIVLNDDNQLYLEIMNTEDGELVQSEMKVSSAGLMAAQSLCATHGFGKALPAWEFIGWVVTGAPPVIKS